MGRDLRQRHAREEKKKLKKEKILLDFIGEFDYNKDRKKEIKQAQKKEEEKAKKREDSS